MEIGVGEDNGIVLRKVYSGICLDCENGEKMYICMRDGAFEIQLIKDGEETGWLKASSKGVSKLGASLHVPKDAP